MNIAWIKEYIWAVVIVTVLIILIIVGLNLFHSVTIGDVKHGVGTLFLYGLLICIAASVRTVGPTEIGCLLLFNKPVGNVKPGIVIVPVLICRLVIEKGTVIQDELPTDPEFIYRGSEKDLEGKTVPEELKLKGYKPPIRVTFNGPSSEADTEVTLSDGTKKIISKTDPYNRRLTCEVTPIVRWRIIDFVKFIQNIGDMESARKQMEDTCVEIFTQELTRITPAEALLRMREYSDKLKTALEKTTTTWGVQIEDAQLKGIGFSHELNKAVQAVVEEERNMEANRLKGLGEGARIKGVLDARTEGYTKMKDGLGVGGHIIIGAETARAIAGEGDKSGQKTIIAGSGGFADLIGAATTISETLKKGDSK